MFVTLKRDLDAILARDPAARNRLEIVLCYPGLHALWSHRIAHRLWRARLRLPARFIAQVSRSITGIEIHPGAQLGSGVFIDHGMGVVIGETAEVGDNVTLYHGVTLGGTSLEPGKRHPTIGSGVVVGTGAAVLGNITVGDNSRIGANAVVVKSVPADVVVVGVPGQVVSRSAKEEGRDAPDPIGVTVISLMERVDALEKCLASGGTPAANTGPTAPALGVWRGDDFSI